jgi:cell division protein FtsA
MVDADNFIVALDVGTSKVIALIAQVTADRELDVIGVGKSPCTGLKRGMVVDIEETTRAISAAIKEAENMASCRVHSAFVGIAGNHIASRNLQGVIHIRDGEVSVGDMERVLENAKTGAVLPDQKVLHIIPQEFSVDGQYEIRNPMGMSGVRLEGHYHLVTCGLSALQNLEKCVQGCKIGIDEVILEDEKTLGVCLIDIGAGTSDIALYTHGALRYTEIVAVGGEHVTNDIAHVLRTPLIEAEQLKIKQACAQSISVKREEYINVPSTGDRAHRKLERHVLASIVEARYLELFEYIRDQLKAIGLYDYLSAGIVLTGGAARIEGAAALAESVFGLQVRLGVPNIRDQNNGEIVRNPAYATSVGLLMAGRDKVLEGRTSSVKRPKTITGAESIVQRLRVWLEKHF